MSHFLCFPRGKQGRKPMKIRYLVFKMKKMEEIKKFFWKRWNDCVMRKKTKVVKGQTEVDVQDRPRRRCYNGRFNTSIYTEISRWKLKIKKCSIERLVINLVNSDYW